MSIIRNGKEVGRITRNGKEVFQVMRNGRIVWGKKYDNTLIWTGTLERLAINGNKVAAEEIASPYKTTKRLTSLYTMMGVKDAEDADDPVTEVDMTGMDTRAVKDLSCLFYNRASLKSIKAGGLDTRKNKTLYGAFYGCKALTDVDLSGWDTSQVENMRAAFYGCAALTGLDVTGWDVSRVKNFRALFSTDAALTELKGIGDWDVSSAESLVNMFYSTALTELDLSKWNPANATEMQQMFYGCTKLTTIGDVSGWDTGKVTNMRSMFCGNTALTELDLSEWDTSKVTDMAFTFYGTGLTTIGDVSQWDTSNVTNMQAMFCDSANLGGVDPSNWDVRKVTTMRNIFYHCGIEELDLSKWKTESLTGDGLAYAFRRMDNLKKIVAPGLDVSRCTAFGGVCSSCHQVTYVDFSGWDLSSATDMGGGLQYLPKCEYMDLSGWEIPDGCNIGSFFQGSFYESTTGEVALKQLRLAGCSEATREKLYAQIASAVQAVITWDEESESYVRTDA